ncbi:Aste57867_382 [Aphanomyces stellatus]|uniref:Aste57867_382 protein n=1 Tax=Aphanomyces stellatus TaxID=120398 RepID=A0A485K5L1_9STRA|nr:hypothetical protein As57867_000381 [Aphanomyces stellatus]VFT77607.1 Aste57867_382 [Aphanomyces stellatus]
MWQSFVVVAIMLLVLFLALFAIRRYPFPSDATMVAETSTVLLGFRVAVFIFFCVCLIGYSDTTRAYAYYTTWNFALQTVYFGWALKYQWCHRRATAAATSMTKEGRILSTFFDVVFATSFLVCLVFWGIIYPARANKAIQWPSVLRHGGNVILLLVEFALNGRTVRISSLGYIIAFPLVYGTFSWIGHETWQQGFWAYSFLDVAKTLSPAWYIGVCLIHTLFLVAAIGLSKLKWRCRLQPETTAANVETPDKYAAMQEV